MSASTMIPGPSAKERDSPGPSCDVVPNRSKYVISRAGNRGARLKSVPLVQATGSITISVMWAGMPRISLIRASSCSAAVTHVEPRPRARRARQKLHAACRTESNRPGRLPPSWRPMMVGMTMAGTSARWSTRYDADAITFSCGCPVPRSRSAVVAMNAPAVSRYTSASCSFTARSRTTIQRRLPRLPPVGACSARSMQSSSNWLSTGRSRSSRLRTARVVASTVSTWAGSMFMRVLVPMLRASCALHHGTMQGSRADIP